MSKEALGRVVALVAVAVIAGMGFCLPQADHTAGQDLCASALTTAVALFVALSLADSGRLLPAVAEGYRRYPPDLPAPPPKA